MGSNNSFRHFIEHQANEIHGEIGPQCSPSMYLTIKPKKFYLNTMVVAIVIIVIITIFCS